ncbi:AMP-binding protein [Microcoleus sp. C2C3]|uniref:AMP-binding protein n=1 Tax=unclassified Microcoleus TaxID=2642155 RepID=UPI002FD4B52A
MEWNNTKFDKCVHQLCEAQVERSPDAVAVVFEDQPLTYRELNAKANQLAHYLQKLSVKPEVLVGICVQRSSTASSKYSTCQMRVLPPFLPSPPTWATR